MSKHWQQSDRITPACAALLLQGNLQRSMAAKGILIGLGNPIMSDDRIGLVVAQEVHTRLSDFDLEMSSLGGFDVVDRIVGHGTAVIIDSMVSRRWPPGTVVRIEPESSLKTLRSKGTHGANFVEAIEMAESCGAPVPMSIMIYGIEVEDPFSLGDEISKPVLEKLDTIVQSIVDEILGEENNTCTS